MNLLLKIMLVNTFLKIASDLVSILKTKMASL